MLGICAVGANTKLSSRALLSATRVLYVVVQVPTRPKVKRRGNISVSNARLNAHTIHDNLFLTLSNVGLNNSQLLLFQRSLRAIPSRHSCPIFATSANLHPTRSADKPNLPYTPTRYVPIRLPPPPSISGPTSGPTAEGPSGQVAQLLAGPS